MLNDLDICNLAAATYNPEYQWDKLIQGAADDDVYCGIKTLDTFNCIAFRGSTTPQDWLRDFNAIPFNHPLLGDVHRGFVEGLDETCAEIIQSLNQRTVVTGHSLGAARAILFGCLLAAHGKPPQAIIVFGAPNPGYAGLRKLIESVPNKRSYKNRQDPVTDVPVPILDVEPWDCVIDRTLLNVPPPPNDEWGPLQDHHIELYAAGTQMLAPIPVIQ